MLRVQDHPGSVPLDLLAFDKGKVPVASQPRVSLASVLMIPHPALRPYGCAPDLFARHVPLVHLASLVSFLFFFLLCNTLGFELTLGIAPFAYLV